MIFLKTSLLASLFVFHGAMLYGCKEVSETSPVKVTISSTAPSPPTNSIKKYGAAIQFSHSYDGSSNIDEAENFELTFQPTQAIHTLSIELRSPDNILLGGDKSLAQVISGNAAVTIPVSILAKTEGKFYLNILVQTEQDGRRLGRAFAVAINVGELPTAQKANAGNGDNVHVMPAQEEIR